MPIIGKAITSGTSTIEIKTFVIWDGSEYNSSPSSSPAGGFVAIQGSTSSQNDTITYPSNPACVYYIENNNDYGGIRTTNAISFDGYTTLNITIDLINSWQDDPYYASVVIDTQATTRTNSSGMISVTSGKSEHIDENAGNHLTNRSYNYSTSIANYTGTYYIYVTCTSGEKSGIGKGALQISKIWLEK